MRRWFVGILLTVVLATLALEGLLRLAGRQPGQHLRRSTLEPLMHQPDAEIGWVPKPGTYTYPGYSPGSPPVSVTFWRDGARATRPVDDVRGERLVLVGDSMVMGWAVSDAETFAWGLQSEFPALDVRNYGVGGYGTYQSALRLRRVLDASDRPVRAVVYGFGEWQAMRNVALPPWVIGLEASSQGAAAKLPYCRMVGDGALACEPPSTFPLWPGWYHSALVAAAQGVSIRRTTDRLTGEMVPVTERLFVMMNDIAQQHHTPLLIVLMGTDAAYRDALTRRGLRFVDCGRPFERSLTVAGESHPNAEAHKLFAACIAQGLKAKILESQIW
jgi:hypothetical protein